MVFEPEQLHYNAEVAEDLDNASLGELGQTVEAVLGDAELAILERLQKAVLEALGYYGEEVGPALVDQQAELRELVVLVRD